MAPVAAQFAASWLGAGLKRFSCLLKLPRKLLRRWSTCVPIRYLTITQLGVNVYNLREHT